jgi:hypothetical protein
MSKFISICILLFIFMAPLAIAEQPPGKGNVKKSETLNFVLMDCGNLDCGRDPQQVGNVVSVENDGHFRQVLSLVKFIDSEGVEQTIGLNFQADQIPYQAETTEGSCGDCVWFESTDCDETNPSEQGYIKADPIISFFPTFTPFAVVGLDNQPDVRKLFISTGGVAQNITARSKIEDNIQGCVGGGPPDPFLAIPVELTDPDLHMTFKPPFTLERK